MRVDFTVPHVNLRGENLTRPRPKKTYQTAVSETRKHKPSLSGLSPICGNHGPTSACVQEMGIPFRCLSTSEPDSAFRSFQAANHTVMHQFTSLEKQISDRKLRQPGSDVDLLVVGSPCNPFSRMRGKRFHADSVMNHQSYNTTFVEVYKAFEAFEPKAAVMEQTAGFGLPFDCSTAETPLQRRGKQSLYCNAAQ